MCRVKINKIISFKRALFTLEFIGHFVSLFSVYDFECDLWWHFKKAMFLLDRNLTTLQISKGNDVSLSGDIWSHMFISALYKIPKNWN
jgi:hypothetical protein